MPLWLCAAAFLAPSLEAAQAKRTGAEIYRTLCAGCHGTSGEGVADKHDEPLYGDRSLKSLTRLIERTMPEDDPKKCRGDDAARVAAYIYEAFYSPAARARNRPPRVELARLTVPQYLNVVADLAGSFQGRGESIDARRGLSGQYYAARNFRSEKKAFERVDPQIQFDFGQENPDPSRMDTNEFSIRWRGSVLAKETGEYEFILKTENGARLWVNGEGNPLIDAWVSSGTEPREHRETVRLLGGRAYPIQIDYFKFKEKTASIAVSWKPPHRVREIVPERNLAPRRVPETLVVTTPFPPDDSSVGYERGTAVSKAWDQAATFAAIEAANKILDQLDSLAGAKPGAPDRLERLKRFAEQFAERAFRRPLTLEQKRFFVEAQFEGVNDDPDRAIKRVILLVFKSPRFLYPEIGGGDPDDFDVASRLSFALWDSLPDPELLEAAAQGNLRNPGQVAAHAERMLQNPRARAKLGGFFRRWLEMEKAEEISKDPAAFPDFNEVILSDMRTSLELFLNEVVWSEASDYRQLLLADYLFLNERLARFLGLPFPDDSSRFQKVSFNPKERAGVITHPYLLSAFAYHKSSSPIHRGVFLTRNIVGRSLKPPPMAIEFMDGRFDPSLTMREKVAELTRSAACQGCHSVINPLGFSLEHYDAVGRFRTTDNRKPIDATGEYTTTEGDTVRLSGARDLAHYAAESVDAHRGFVRQLFQHLVKQPAEAYGPNTIEDLRRSFAAAQFHLRKLAAEIVSVSALHGVPAGGKKKALAAQ